MAYQTRQGCVVLVASGRRGHVLPPAVRQEMGLADIMRSWCYREHGSGTSFTELGVHRLSSQEAHEPATGAGAYGSTARHGQTAHGLTGRWATGRQGLRVSAPCLLRDPIDKRFCKKLIALALLDFCPCTPTSYMESYESSTSWPEPIAKLCKIRS